MQHEQEREIDADESNNVVIRQCMNLTQVILDQQGCLIDDPDGVRHLCLVQQHMHRKGIIFTSFIFSLVIAEMLGIEFMWSTIAGDPTVGGVSSGRFTGPSSIWPGLRPLVLHRVTVRAGLALPFDYQLCRPFLWYMQKVFCKRMDRHLTTNLLVCGWGVIFASDVLPATKTPTTVTRWLRQQVRWARATHIESRLIPRVYAMSHPRAFSAAARREFGPVVVAVVVLSYFLTSHKLLYFSYPDLFLRIGITTVYNILRNPDRLRLALSWYVVPDMFFYNIPLPAIHIWSLVTMTAGTWGTAMRASTEISKKDSSRKKWFGWELSEGQ
ncbi:hypothetical protein FOYG_00025 [Fusarium oxysporum NRRL 32931]|uniref:Uncharacterized protein n=1 Tax=Fusarium oxysporum NRRL 32931 TaxID=660029 RepID=W9J5P5_FUSOX|nr:hypothetical protein FOYG_00025 [Fusarium oxysporum NRRL 32931]